MRRSRSCPQCAWSGGTGSARFCGRCGALLDRSPSSSGSDGVVSGHRAARGGGARRIRQRHRIAVAAGVSAIGIVVVAGVLITGPTPGGVSTDDLAIDLPGPGTVPPAGEATGPDATGPDATAPGDAATPEQRDGGDTADGRAGTRGRGLDCQPRGCEQWRVRLAGELQELAVTSRWIAVIDGSRLRVRGTNRSDPGGSGWTTDLREVRTPDGDPALAEAPDGRVPVTALAIADDGTILAGQRNRIVALGPGGELRWSAGVNQLRAVQVHAERVVVFSAPDGRPDSSLERATSRSLADGALGWSSHTGRPLEGATFGLVTLGPSDRLELIDPGTGAVRWDLDLQGPRWARVEGPWIVANRGRSDEALLIDGDSGEVLQSYDGLVPLGGIQRRDGIAVGSWLRTDGDGTPDPTVTTTGTTATAGDRTDGQVVVIAWDDAGTELWQREIPVALDGPCCVIALPWSQGTVAIGRPGAPDEGWRFRDASTGHARDPDTIDPPSLPLQATSRSGQPSPRIGSVFAATDGRTLWLAAGGGTATVQGAAGASLVSIDPPVLVRPGELIGLRLIPAG